MDTFKCSYCGQTYEKAYSDEQALAEKDILFPGLPVEECDIVCDDCFRKAGFEPTINHETTPPRNPSHE